MNAAYYSGHDLEWTQKFIDAIPKKKGLSYAKAVCIAEVLQHRYTLEKRKEIKLDHKTLKSFGVNRHNLEKYLPYFEKANLIKWKRKGGVVPKIILISIPPNYVKNNGTTSTNRLNRIKTKGTCPTVAQVTCPTVAQVEKPQKEAKKGKGNRSKQWE